MLRRVIFIVILVLLVSTPLVYYFFWRPSSDAYWGALSYVNTLRDSTNHLTFGLDNTKLVSEIDYTTFAYLNKISRTYDDAAKKLSQSQVITQDAKVNSVYKQYEKAINEYGTGVSKYKESVKLYLTIVRECNKLEGLLEKPDSSELEKAQKNCESAIDAGKESPDTVFNEQFFNKYLVLVSALSDEFQRYVKTDIEKEKRSIDLSAVKISQDIVKLQEVESKTSLMPAPTEAFDKLTSVLEAQEKSFLR